MHLTTILSVAAALFSTSLAVPHPMPVLVGGIDDGSDPKTPIGDLATIGATTDVGRAILNMLLTTTSAMSDERRPMPRGKACDMDPCCMWFKISDDLTDLFRGRTGRCNDAARAAVRLGFHDAGTWSKKLAAQGDDFGGADGSFILFNELSRGENKGLEDIVKKMQKIMKKYPSAGVGDLIQFAANHATVTCPLGPRIRTFIGRIDATKAAPPNLLPSVHSPADVLIDLFKDKTFDAHGLAALVGAHSVSKQFNQDPTRVKAPQDTTPGIWDVSFYNETLQPDGLPKNVFKFDSDVALSKHPQVASEWQMFITDQHHWNEDYAHAYLRLSLLGVNNINQLTECTAALPAARPTFQGFGDKFIDE